MMIQHKWAWHARVYTCFIPKGSCYHIPVMWTVMVVIQSAICWHLWVDVYPSTKHMWSCQSFCQQRHPWLLHIAWNHHPSSLDALADIHERSHGFPFIHPWEVFLAWCWVIARPLSSCGIVSLSLPLGVGLTGVGLVHLTHAWWMPMHKEPQFLMLWGGVNCNTGSIYVPVGLSLCMRGCLSWSDALPHEVCSPICPWSFSSLERYLPWLGQDCYVSNLWHQFPSHSIASVFEPLP